MKRACSGVGRAVATGGWGATSGGSDAARPTPPATSSVSPPAATASCRRRRSSVRRLLDRRRLRDDGPPKIRFSLTSIGHRAAATPPGAPNRAQSHTIQSVSDPDVPSGTVRAIDVLGAMSLAADLALGLPVGHGVRATYIGMRLADALAIAPDQHVDVYYA